MFKIMLLFTTLFLNSLLIAENCDLNIEKKIDWPKPEELILIINNCLNEEKNKSIFLKNYLSVCLDYALEGNKKVLEELLLKVPNAGNLSELHKAIIFCEENRIIEIIESGADVNAVDSWGADPTFYLKCNNSVKILEKIIKLGLNPNRQDTSGRTALYFTDNPDLLKVFLINGWNPNLHDNEGRGIIHYLCYYGINDEDFDELLILITTLLENGADVNLKDKNGYTAADLLLSDWSFSIEQLKKHNPKGYEVLQLLFRNGAAFPIKDTSD